MSLNWDLTGVADSAAVKTDEEWPTTEALIWATLAVGLGEITEANALDFSIRLGVWRRVTGQDPISHAAVARRIGLRTNVGRESIAEWRRRIMDYLILDARLRVSDEQRDAADPRQVAS